MMKPVTSKNAQGFTENYIMKIALLGRGEVLGDEEVIKHRRTTYMCSCYSTVGELLSISSEDFLLKVQKDEYLKEFHVKSKSKDILRDGRMQNFQDYLVNHQFKNQEEESRIIITPAQFPHAKIIQKAPASYKNNKPFTPKTIEKIKKKALGRKNTSKRYSSLSYQVESLSKGQTCTENFMTKRSQTPSLILKPMIKHRPGGYFRANLKKSWAG